MIEFSLKDRIAKYHFITNAYSHVHISSFRSSCCIIFILFSSLQYHISSCYVLGSVYWYWFSFFISTEVSLPLFTSLSPVTLKHRIQRRLHIERMSRKDQIFDDEEGEPSSSAAVIIENDVQKLSLVDNIDPEEDENLGHSDESIYRTTIKVVKDDSVPVEKGNLCRGLCCWILFLIAFGVPSWKVTSYFREINSIQVKKASTTQKESHLTHGPRYSRYPLNGANVEQIVLLGERNSGQLVLLSFCFFCITRILIYFLKFLLG